MTLKPWYKVVYPREDLRENKPLDASEFAVHLDQVRDGRARADYQQPQRFFETTFLTQNLASLASEVLRRLAGNITETSAVFNLTTQFGGGKTHALTLLYHLARQGSAVNGWLGVGRLLEKAGLASVPQAAVAVFVGTEFDSLTGRGGSDGTPLRRTPWGEIAYQLGGEGALAVLEEHEKQFIEPKGDVIRAFLPHDRPVLILMDEIVNYVSTYRKLGYHNRLYNFIQSLSETARGRENVILVVSLPASEMEYTADDEADQQRFEKMLDRLGKAVMMSAETETAEIIRRRLFEWDLRALSADGRVLLPQEARQTCDAYADWILEHRSQLPGDFPIDRAREVFAETYPFHPTVFSVFERKWQALPRFQRTRGVLRLMALWVARAYQEGYGEAQRDPLIGIGSAPLEDPSFRAAVFEQLGENRLEAAVTTDIAGKKDAHALRLDEEAVETIRKTHLHRKIATAIFFESNGGQQRGDATVPEIRLAESEPDLDIGNIETVLEALRGVDGCYYLVAEGNRFRFELTPNLNKLWADRRANIPKAQIDERVRAEIERVFKTNSGIEHIYFVEESRQIADRAVLAMIVLAPEHSIQKEDTLWLIDEMTRQAGSSGRTFKSALLWMVAEEDAPLKEEARKLLAWEVIEEEHARKQLQLDETQERQLQEALGRSRRDLREAVWRQYKNLVLLDKENELKILNLGLVHSSAAESLVGLVLNRLRQMDEVVDTVSPNFLLRNWIAGAEWSTQAVRDAFFASPRFPRLTNSDAIRETIARGVSAGLLAYVGKSDDKYQPFTYNQTLNPLDVEISEDLFIISKETTESYLARAREKRVLTTVILEPSRVELSPGGKIQFRLRCLDQRDLEMKPDYLIWSAEGGTMDQAGNFVAGHEEGNYQINVIADQMSATSMAVIGHGAAPPYPQPPSAGKLTRLVWEGVIPSQKWMNFYTRVLARFATLATLKLSLRFEVTQPEGLSTQKVDETRAALNDLGLDETIRTE